MFASTILLITSLALVKTAKILVVVPTPVLSHQIVFRPLIQELVNRDHQVTVITTDPMYPHGEAPNNLREIDVHNISYTRWVEWFRKIENVDQNDFLSKVTFAYYLLSDVFIEQLKDKLVQELINNKSQKFDLLILEACVNPALILSHVFKAPVILMSSFGAMPGHLDMMGALSHPFLYPTHFHRRIYNLTVLEKINELYKHVMLDRAVEKLEFNDNKMLQTLFGNNIPTLSELKKNIDMLFLNVHPLWVHNQPVPPNVIYTWGIHKKPDKVLSKDLQSHLDTSKNGVIYISFGTNFHTSSMRPETVEILLKVLSLLPYNVLWKWDTDELPGKSANIKFSKWFPQSDVLRHPNLKLIITHGGLHSTDEAIISGVPLIAIPTNSDQDYNAEKYVYFKIGIRLEFKSLTVERFENAINTIFTNYDSYHNNIVRLRTQMQDQPQPPLERAIWWIEYVLRHGGATQLRTPAAYMSWTEYYELKLVFLLLSGLMVLVTLLLLLMYFSYKYILRIINLRVNKTKLS